MKIGIKIAATPGCCGVKQLHDFSDVFDHNDHWAYLVVVEGKTIAAAYASLYKQMLVQLHKYYGLVIQMWFYKPCEDDYEAEEYEAQPLLDLIAAMPDVLDLGETSNPNSGNLIQGYQWIAK